MKFIDFKKILRYFNKDKDWEIVIVSFGILLIVLISVNIYIFWKFQREIAKPFDQEVRVETLKRNLLESALDVLNGKERKFEQNTLTKPDIIDPSL